MSFRSVKISNALKLERQRWYPKLYSHTIAMIFIDFCFTKFFFFLCIFRVIRFAMNHSRDLRWIFAVAISLAFWLKKYYNFSHTNAQLLNELIAYGECFQVHYSVLRFLFHVVVVVSFAARLMHWRTLNTRANASHTWAHSNEIQ